VLYYIDLDTGSSLLWLQSALNPSDSTPNGQSVYRPSESTTSKDLHTTTSVTYGDGTSLMASLFTDTITIGGLVAHQQLLGAASTASIRSTFLGGKSNGLLGLSLTAANKNLVQNLKAQGVIKYASIAVVGPRNDPKLAREIDRKRTLLPRGQLVVGAVDRRFYTGEIAWCPIVSGERWVVKLDEVRINGRVVFKDQLALIDTGTAYIVTSPTAYAKVKDTIPGTEDIRGRKESRMFSFPEASLRSVEFVFGGRSMELKKQDFGLGGIRDVKTTRMASSIVSLPGERGVEVFSGMETMWIIGGIFLDNVVTIFDYEARKVGFATIAEEK
jgi:cathepsin D